MVCASMHGYAPVSAGMREYMLEYMLESARVCAGIISGHENAQVWASMRGYVQVCVSMRSSVLERTRAYEHTRAYSSNSRITDVLERMREFSEGSRLSRPQRKARLKYMSMCRGQNAPAPCSNRFLRYRARQDLASKMLEFRS